MYLELLCMEALNYTAHFAEAIDSESANDPEKCCSICFFDTMDDANSVRLSCGHRFHRECMIQSYKLQNVQGNNAREKVCPYCRTRFKYLPYTGGAHVPGLYDPGQVKALGDSGNFTANIVWEDMIPEQSVLYIKSGRYRYEMGTFVAATSKMVKVKLKHNQAVIRVSKENVLLQTAPAPAPAPAATHLAV